MVKKLLKTALCVLLAALLGCVGSFSAAGQQKDLIRVTGVITGDDGEPLIGAAAYAENNRKGGVVPMLTENSRLRSRGVRYSCSPISAVTMNAFRRLKR